MVKFDARTIAVKQVKRRIKVKMEKIRRLSDISKMKLKDYLMCLFILRRNTLLRENLVES